MSYKNSSLVIIFLLSLLSSYSQQFNISWGDNSRISDNYEDAIMLNNGNYLLLKFEPIKMFKVLTDLTPDPSLMLVNQNMVPIKETKTQIDEKNEVYEGLRRYGNNIFLIYHAYDKENHNTMVFAIKINEQTATPAGKIVLGIFESDGIAAPDDIILKVSPDSSKIMLFAEGPDRKKENKGCYMAVFDTDFKRSWGRWQELPFNGLMASFYDADVSNDGKVFAAVKHYDKDVTRESVRENGEKIPSYSYQLFVYSKDKPARQISFDIKNQFIQGTKLVYGKDGRITVAGLYKKKFNGNITGAFYSSFDSTTAQVNNVRIIEFPADILALVDNDKLGKSGGSDPGISAHFHINHILLRPDGSVDLLSEFYYSILVVERDRSTMTTREYPRYLYGDIIDINLDNTGKATFTRIPKWQEGYERKTSLGYYPAIYHDKLILFYNDNINNIDRDLSKDPEHYTCYAKKSDFVAAIIGSKGALTRQMIYSYRDETQLALPESMSRISESKYLITSARIALFGSRTRFGVLEIK